VREDGYHAVIECPHAKALREAMRKVWQLPGENWLRNTGPQWLLVPLDTGTVEEVANLELILWRVWLDRNKVTQAGESLSITGSVEFLMQLQEYEVGRSERRLRARGEEIGLRNKMISTSV
jgi:hypothetical protein